MKNIVIGIIGGKGGMGSYYARFFSQNGYKVIISDLKTKLTNKKLAKDADVIIISVPIDKTEAVIKEVGPYIKAGKLLMDLTSFKVFPMEAMSKYKCDYLGCHPMFGPTANIAGQFVIICPGRGNKWFKWLKELFIENGVIVKELTADQHDELVAYIQALTHFSDIAFADSLRKSKIPIQKFIEHESPIYRLELDMMGRILAQDPYLYANIQIKNPLSKKVMKSFIESCEKLFETVKNKNVNQNVAFFKKCSKYLGGFCKEAMNESDKLLAYLEIGKKAIKKQDIKKCNIAILGPKNTYSEMALEKHNKKAKPWYANSIAEVFEMVVKDKVQEGLVPIENSVAGSIRETLDELYYENTWIEKVIAQPINLALVGKRKIPVSRIKIIYSHTQPLLQSRGFLKNNCPKATLVPVASTSAALERIIKEDGDTTVAIASPIAAKAYRLSLLSHSIEDDSNNTTFFALIKKRQKINKAKNTKKTSIAFHFNKDSPGSLHAILKDFAESNINLSKIESRPNIKVRGQYVFYIDFEKGIQNKEVQKVLKKVEKKVAHLKVLGSY